MKRAIAFVGLTLCVFQLHSQGVEAAKDTMQLQVSIESVRAYTNWAEFQLLISGSNTVPLKLSRFSLINLLRAVKFTDTNKQAWGVRYSGRLEHPPPPDVDFNVLIAPATTNRVRIATEPIVSLSKGDAASSPSLPVLLQYELSREVGAINETTGRFSWVVCKGAGTVEVQWMASEK